MIGSPLLEMLSGYFLSTNLSPLVIKFFSRIFTKKMETFKDQSSRVEKDIKKNLKHKSCITHV